LGTAVNATTGERFDVFLELVTATCCYATLKVVVDAVHHIHHQLAFGFVPFARRAEDIAAFAALVFVRADADPIPQAVGDELAADHTDRAGNRHRVGKDGVCQRRDVVATAGGDVTHRDDERTTIGFEAFGRFANDVGRQRRSARRVHAQHERLHRRVVGGFGNRAANRVATGVFRTAEETLLRRAGRDGAFDVNDGDGGVARRSRRLHHIAEHLKHAERVIEVEVRLFAGLVRRRHVDIRTVAIFHGANEVFAIHQVIDKAGLLGFLSAEHADVDQFAYARFRKVTALGDVFDHLLKQAVEQAIHLRRGLFAGAGARERLGGRFEIAAVHHVGFDADLTEHVFEIHALRIETVDHYFAGRHEQEARGFGTEQHRSVRQPFGQYPNVFAGGLERFDLAAQFLNLGEAKTSLIDIENDAFEVGILLGGVQFLDQRIHADGAGIAQQFGEARLIGLFGHGAANFEHGDRLAGEGDGTTGQNGHERECDRKEVTARCCG